MLTFFPGAADIDLIKAEKDALNISKTKLEKSLNESGENLLVFICFYLLNDSCTVSYVSSSENDKQ